MNKKTNISENEIERNAPTLFGMDKNDHSFKAPDEYFDTLYASIQDNISNQSTSYWGLVWKTSLKLSPIAAILIVAFFFLSPRKTNQLEKLTNFEIIAYLENDVFYETDYILQNEYLTSESVNEYEAYILENDINFEYLIYEL